MANLLKIITFLKAERWMGCFKFYNGIYRLIGIAGDEGPSSERHSQRILVEWGIKEVPIK